MKTNHLFFTVRMIWNHSAPDDGKLRPYKKYEFGKYYTPDYIKEAIPIMLHELLWRKDIKPSHAKELDFMLDYSQLKQMNSQQLN